MRKVIRTVGTFLLGLGIPASCGSLARAQDVPSDYQQVFKLVGRSGDYKANVLKVNIPRMTRKDIKVDRVACPWLIRRFVDPHAEFLFVEEKDLLEQAKQQGAIPFDAPKIDAIKLNHRGPRCTFEAIVEDYKVGDPAVSRLALIVRAADVKGQEGLAAETSVCVPLLKDSQLWGYRMRIDWRANFLSMMLSTRTFKLWESESASPSRSRPDQRSGLPTFARRRPNMRCIGDRAVEARPTELHRPESIFARAVGVEDREFLGPVQHHF